MKKGKNVLLSIDVKGAMQIKKRFPESTFIFIKPPSLKELSSRLKARNADSRAQIDRRLAIAREELSYSSKYDYIVCNNKLKNAIKKTIAIIKNEQK